MPDDEPRQRFETVFVWWFNLKALCLSSVLSCIELRIITNVTTSSTFEGFWLNVIEILKIPDESPEKGRNVVSISEFQQNLFFNRDSGSFISPSHPHRILEWNSFEFPYEFDQEGNAEAKATWWDSWERSKLVVAMQIFHDTHPHPHLNLATKVSQHGLSNRHS